VEQLGVLCYRVHLQCRSSDIMCRHHVRHMIMSRSEVADPNVHGVLNERESLPICYTVFPVPAPRDALWTSRIKSRLRLGFESGTSKHADSIIFFQDSDSSILRFSSSSPSPSHSPPRTPFLDGGLCVNSTRNIRKKKKKSEKKIHSSNSRSADSWAKFHQGSTSVYCSIS